ncbi:hypothetical protein [Campylobacter sp. US33a]|uniref:Uncharacterized protein n=1 Tax=Campylobacter sp. CCS1377 TaxID=3158229 RepID=A0AAU7E6T7_9BACT|nr:hypothetical protein [Campylobacter sp. US33a]MCW1360963.1 hypothetical protein [Campylobacter jejuni]TEY01590.1 hypothetical protein ELQ16_07425 [Campylobacter sp. US33a]
MEINFNEIYNKDYKEQKFKKGNQTQNNLPSSNSDVLVDFSKEAKEFLKTGIEKLQKNTTIQQESKNSNAKLEELIKKLNEIMQKISQLNNKMQNADDETKMALQDQIVTLNAQVATIQGQIMQILSAQQKALA